MSVRMFKIMFICWCRVIVTGPYSYAIGILEEVGNFEDVVMKCLVFVGDAYQFLSACFRNLTNAINSIYYQVFTMRNVWESVVSEA